MPRSSQGVWHPIHPEELWDCYTDLSYRNDGRSLDRELARGRFDATYFWFVYGDDENPPRFVRVGEVRQTAERKRNPPRDEAYLAQIPTVFHNWLEWRPVDVDMGQVSVPSEWLDNVALRPIYRSFELWPVFEGLVERVEGTQATGREGNRDMQQTVASSGALAVPVPSAAFDAAHPQTLADQSTWVNESMEDQFIGDQFIEYQSIEDCENKSFANLSLERKDPQVEGYVYLISMQKTQYYKIGMSLDPFSRLQTLQTGNPHTLRRVREKRVPNMLVAESRLHHRFAAWRVPDTTAREWFKFSDKEILEKVEPAFDEL